MAPLVAGLLAIAPAVPSRLLYFAAALLLVAAVWPEKCRFARRLCGRVVELSWLYLPVLSLLPLAWTADSLGICLRGDGSASPRPGAKPAAAGHGRKDKTWLDSWWSLLLCKCQRSGPVVVKLGQWAATRRDLLPEEWCDQLGRLHDDTEAHSLQFTHKVLDEAFPANRAEGPWHKRLMLEPLPVGSGCIAQVYIGHLILEEEDESAAKRQAQAKRVPATGCLDGARALFVRCLPQRGSYTELAKSKLQRCIKVAVKVVHPQVRRAVDIDLKVMHLLAWFCDCLGLDHLGASLMLRQFADFLEAQTDLRREARNLKVFRDRLGPSSVLDGPVIVPEVFDAWVAREALVMSFEEGRPLGELLTASDAEMGAEKAAAWRTIVDLFWGMVFQHRFVHGDMHPGNLFWRRSRSGAVQLVLLDCGLVIDLSGQAGEDLSMMVKAFLTKTEEEVAALLIQLSSRVGGRPEDVVDREGFIRGIANLIREGNSVKYQLSKLNAGVLMGRSLLLGRQHRVRFDARFVNLMVAMVVLQGVAMRLHGEGDVVGRMMPFVLGAAVSEALGGRRPRPTEPEEEPRSSQ